MFQADPAQLGRLNSMTKYPSILTYHQIGERGKLDSNIQVPFEDDEDVIITEKVDGANARIIFLPTTPRDYFIGSREELLHAKGDRIWVPTEGIVDTLKEHDFVSKVYRIIFSELDLSLTNIWVVFGEVFGGKTSQHKQYSGKKATGFRVFDVAKIPRPLADDMILGNHGWNREKISSWRQRGGQIYLPNYCLENLFLLGGGPPLSPLTPRLTELKLSVRVL
jgi:hypothetical protein